jgi:putative oxidoreductase
MTVAIRTLHAKNGYSIEKEGYEFTLSLAMASAALAVLGPGRLSGDRVFGLHETLAGVVGAFAAATAVPIAFGYLAALWHKPEPAPVAPAAPASDSPAAVGGDPEVAQA